MPFLRSAQILYDIVSAVTSELDRGDALEIDHGVDTGIGHFGDVANDTLKIIEVCSSSPRVCGRHLVVEPTHVYHTHERGGEGS